MRHYRVTENLRNRVNEFLRGEYLKKDDVGRELSFLKNYEAIARVSPEKARLLMAVLFPEQVKEPSYIASHMGEIRGLAKQLHIKGEGRPNWTYFLVRREWAAPEDIKRAEGVNLLVKFYW